MTQERFYKLLENPEELLPRITYEEIKTLSLAYPFSNNLKTLLALKAKMDEHPEASRSLATAAAYSIDRTRLFLLMMPILAVVPEKAVAEAVLELKPIESIQRKLEALETLAVEKETEEVATPKAESIVAESEPKIEAAPRESLHEAITLPGFEAFVPKPTSPKQSQSFNAWYNQFNLPLLDPKPTPSPVAEHKSVDSFEPAPVDESDRESKKRPTTGLAQTLAERSVSENKDVVSETLAKLLARQGHKDRAIAMYERLCLAIPEKSAFFAAEIEKLRS